MGLPITKVEDYVGEYAISTDKYAKEKLAGYITRYETIYLNRLLGCEMAVLFIADLDVNGVPQTPIYINIFNMFCKQDGCGTLYESTGIKEMLLGFIYFEYVKNNNTFASTGGNNSKEAENSKLASAFMHNVFNRYNLGAITACAIQWFIEDDNSKNDSVNYSTFEGIGILLNHWSL